MSEQNQTLEAFIIESDKIFAEGLAKAQTLPANTIQVWPGGATFNTIQMAIDSITDASVQLQYQITVGAGTYSENITLKDYVFIIGAGQTNTFITAPGKMGYTMGVVNTASTSGIGEVTITATGGFFGTSPIAIKIMGNGRFRIRGAAIISSDGGNFGNTVRGITNNNGAFGGELVVGQSTIDVSCVNQSTAQGIELLGINGLAALIQFTSITVTAPLSFGITTALGATVTIADSEVAAAGGWALYDADDRSTISAYKCTLDGMVSGGVVVNA